MRNYVKGIVFIILCFSIFGCTGCSHSEEYNTQSESNNHATKSKGDMPNIIFMYRYNYADEEFGQYTIDKEGNIYYTNDREIVYCEYSELLGKYRSGDFQSKSIVVGTVEYESIEEKYYLMRQIVDDGEYEVVSYGESLDMVTTEEDWYFIFNDENEIAKIMQVFCAGEVRYFPNDPRVLEIVEWFNNAIEYDKLEQGFR